MSHADQHAAPRQRPLNKLISDCRTMIQEELGAFFQLNSLNMLISYSLDSIALENNIKSSIKMNYTNYERNIVEHRSFVLVGWPLGGPVWNPSKVGGRSGVESLLRALHQGSCHWVKLTDTELYARMKDNRARAARGEPVYVARKRKNTASLKNGGTDMVMSSDGSSSSSEGSSSDSD